MRVGKIDFASCRLYDCYESLLHPRTNSVYYIFPCLNKDAYALQPDGESLNGSPTVYVSPTPGNPGVPNV